MTTYNVGEFFDGVSILLKKKDSGPTSDIVITFICGPTAFDLTLQVPDIEVSGRSPSILHFLSNIEGWQDDELDEWIRKSSKNEYNEFGISLNAADDAMFVKFTPYQVCTPMFRTTVMEYTRFLTSLSDGIRALWKIEGNSLIPKDPSKD